MITTNKNAVTLARPPRQRRERVCACPHCGHETPTGYRTKDAEILATMCQNLHCLMVFEWTWENSWLRGDKPQ